MERGLLRVSTAGSVDDGKSTLLGRLLFDAKSIFEDQLSNIAQLTAKRGGVGGNREAALAHDLALFTDGLIAEREQGITIDVAYRYFATPRRKFILADTPGHERYTRNMVTGASTADVAIVLLDAKKGVLAQTKRHLAIAALLGLRHVVVAINKMDLVDFAQSRFDSLVAEVGALAERLGLGEVHYLPMSALYGDAVVEHGTRMPWYSGPTLLQLLETVPLDATSQQPLRLPIQLVSRPGQDSAYVRGYMGRIDTGRIAVGDRIVVEPSGQTSTVEAIFRGTRAVASAHAPHSVTVVVQDALDISRGDLITHASSPTGQRRQFSAVVCWMDEEPLDLRRRYLLKNSTRTTLASVTEVEYRLDIGSLHSVSDAAGLAMNDIGRVAVKTRDVLSADDYLDNAATGAFILIDEISHRTVAAGMIGPSRLDRVHG